VILSVPLAGTFAALGARYPDAGGVSTYVRYAFGPRAAAVVGWCFYFAIYARPDNLRPFAPHGWAAVGSAASLLVWSFTGWEAITHLAAEFRSPSRDLPRAAAIAVGVIGVLYVAVAAAGVLVLGPAAGTTGAPPAVPAAGVGGEVQVSAAAAALLLTLGR
jgi:amino acid efflux transporter